MFSQKLVVVISFFPQMFFGAFCWESQSYLRSGRRASPEGTAQPAAMRVGKCIAGCPPARYERCSEVVLNRLCTALLSCQKWSWTWAGGWVGTLPELPVVTGISELIQAAPSKKGFPFWVEKNHFCGYPEPGKSFLFSNLVRVALL